MSKQYKAKEFFIDLQDDRYEYNEGDLYPREGLEVTEERVAELASNKNRRKRQMIELVPADQGEENGQIDDGENADFPKHTGGGWYELSNGEKVQGKEDAEEAQAKLD